MSNKNKPIVASISNPITEITKILKTGPLLVKLSPNTRGKVSWKVWSKRWVIASSETIAAVDRVEVNLVLDVHKKEKMITDDAIADKNNKKNNAIFSKRFGPQNTILFRCK